MVLNFRSFKVYKSTECLPQHAMSKHSGQDIDILWQPYSSCPYEKQLHMGN